MLLADLALVLGPSQVDLLLVDALLEGQCLPRLSLLSKLLLQSFDFSIKITDLIVEAVLLNVLVFSVIVDLLVNLLTHPVDLFTLLAHLLCIFRDPNSLVVQSLFLLVDGQLFRLLIRRHLSLLSSADLIQACLTFLHDLLKLGEFVALTALQRCRVLIELLPLVLFGHYELLDRLNLEVQFLSLVIVFSLSCVGFFLCRLSFLRL